MKYTNDTSVPLSTGSKDSGVFQIPDGAKEFTFTLKRCTSAEPSVWSDANSHISVTVLISLDGQGWRPLTTYTTHGGVILLKNGQEETENTHSLALDDRDIFATSKNRQIKVLFESTKGTPPDLTFNFFAQ